MKRRVLLSLLLVLGCVHVHGAPVVQDGMEQGSCEDASAIGAAGLALTKINHDRQEGYIFGLHRLSNVHMTKHVSPTAERHHDTEHIHLIFFMQYCFPTDLNRCPNLQFVQLFNQNKELLVEVNRKGQFRLIIRIHIFSIWCKIYICIWIHIHYTFLC